MRLFELFETGENDRIKADLQGLLLSLKAEKTETVPTKVLVKQLNDFGYNLTVTSVLNILTGNPIIKTADSSNVVLSKDNEASVGGGGEENVDLNQMTVDKMAQKGLE